MGNAALALIVWGEKRKKFENGIRENCWVLMAIRPGQ
jgi:hypothetical protein